jgi:acetyl esterase
MPLDPDVRTLLEQMRTLPPFESLTPTAARELIAAITRAGPAGPEVHAVEDRLIETQDGKLPVRIYWATRAPQGIIVYYHGGGWVVGSLHTVDAPLRHLARLTNTCIVSVDYRLAPESRFPAAVLDAHAALNWTHDVADTLIPGGRALFVAGDSAGANLAAVVATMARDEARVTLAGQVLFYPVTDCDFDRTSYVENGDGLFLTRAAMHWFWDHYLPDARGREDPRASPLRAPDLSRLPPTLIQTAEYDPLRDEGEAYAMLLRAAGTPVTLQRRDGLIHGYIGMTAAVPLAATALQDAATWVNATVAGHRG